MELFVAICLVVVGLTIGLLGFKLFKALMPIGGLVVGATIGFTGFQGIFGTGVTSTTIAVLVAVVFGLVLALLSYAFFDLALVIFMGLAFSSLFTLIGLAFGLSAQGFVLGMLSLSGFIVGIVMASSSVLLTESFVTLVTAFVGAGIVLAGVFLLGTGVSLQSLYEGGVINGAAQHASGSFWWVLVWIAGAVIMRQLQLSSIWMDIFPEHLAYHPKSK